MMWPQRAQPPAVQPGDQVGSGGGGGAVRRDERGAATELTGEGAPYLHLGDGVEAGCSVIEDDQPGAAGVGECAGEPEALELPSGHGCVGERGVQASGKAADERVRARGAGRRDDLPRPWLVEAEADG